MSDKDFWRYRVLQALARFVLRFLVRLDVKGLENLPRSGPVLLVMNHLHWLDPPIGLALLTRSSVVFAADKWQTTPILGAVLSWSRHTIWVARGEPDRQALKQAIQVLKADRVLGIAPEGTRSRSGVLQQAHTGAAFLASRTGAPIVPMAVSGQEQLAASLKRLRRVPVRVRVGEPFTLAGTPGRAKGEALETYTTEIMQHVAALLPPEYRGFYTQKAPQ